LPAMLGQAVVAILAGHSSLEAIAQFGREHGTALAHALGYHRSPTPCKASFARVFRRLDVDAFERLLQQWIATRHPDLGEHLALDGKTVRGSKDGEVPAVHLLTAFAPHVTAVLQQLRVEATTNEHQAALQLLGLLPLAGKVVTADAMFCHRDVAAQIVAAGGDYVLAVKDNQATLHADIAALLDAAASLSPPTAGRSRPAYGHPGEQGSWADRVADAA
jgi:hypothetical protein